MVPTKPVPPCAEPHRSDIEGHLTSTFTAGLIRRKARQLIYRIGFTKADQADIEQELRLHLWKKSVRFDRTRSHWNAFATTVVERYTARLIERRRTKKRGLCLNIVSLQTVVTNADGALVRMDQTVACRDLTARTGQGALDGIDRFDLAEDVESVIERCPAELRELCERLKTESPTSVARSLGIARSTLRYRLRDARERFAAAGFEDSSLDGPPPDVEIR